MPDAIFADPRLARLYDAFEHPRTDLVPYLAIARELHATTVVDIGCGTGAFALLASDDGLQATGVDPASASLDVA
ncbi:class I SAM-dependent methyltransferase [Allobranchiibius sp. CTAmp26]|uniref:class I SAM-dependent methyltransferase n=1 Tax=Allobranchiibius sp. CTAmp26 TaxID=2815214 RepID=UPI001FB6075F|nr:class I SAM-dependent methyltransferase [Allobranchiibius sp. CTAmp26]